MHIHHNEKLISLPLASVFVHLFFRGHGALLSTLLYLPAKWHGIYLD